MSAYLCPCRGVVAVAALGCWRSEEHTSELQSHSDLVCRLLLEKKKIKIKKKKIKKKNFKKKKMQSPATLTYYH